MEGLIEVAKESDIPLMLELWRNTPGVKIGEDDELSLAVFIRRNPGTCLLIRTTEGIIGTVLGGFDGRRGYIYHLAVHHDFRGRGYGKKLMHEVIVRLKALKAKKVALFVLNNNQAAMDFYDKQNWVRRQDIKTYSLNTEEYKEK